MWNLDLQNNLSEKPLVENAKSAFTNSSSLNNIFERLRFREGLVWTESLTVEIKLRFQNPETGTRR